MSSALITTILIPPDHLNNLMSLTINCQFLLAKKESHMNLISVHNPDIIFSTESWLKADISSNEVFPTDYSVYRHDCVDGYGSVFIACREILISCELEINDNFTELITCEIKLPNNSQVIACSIYCPPSSGVDYLTNLCNRLEYIRSL